VIFYNVNPPAGSVTITSTVTNQNNQVQDISHYSLRLVDAPDECPDVSGFQSTNTECEPDPCPDVVGIQTSTDECEPDECPDVLGIQSHSDECEPDECPTVTGVQWSKDDCEQDDKKVWVCKFVASEHAPGGYQLKDGKQPIEVSENALGDDVNNTGTFKDAQPSFVVPSDDVTLCVHTHVVVVEHVVCPNEWKDGVVNITTTTTLYYGTTPIGDPVVVHSTRALTPAELAQCPKEDKKVWVCKFVASENSPGGYRLKDGKQPIEVSENALGDDVNDTGTFKDGQPSFVVPSDDATLCSHTTVVVVEHIVCPATGVVGIVNITTTTTLFYGTTQIGDSVVVHSTRALTAAELAACPKVIIVVNPPPTTTLPVTNGIENASLIIGAGLMLMLAGGSMFWVTRRNSKFE
jgi:hypothetical protein